MLKHIWKIVPIMVAVVGLAIMSDMLFPQFSRFLTPTIFVLGFFVMTWRLRQLASRDDDRQ